MFEGKSILLIGGARSCGRQHVRTLLGKHSPRRPVIYCFQEFKQFEMQQDSYEPYMRYFIGDVRYRARTAHALRRVDFAIRAAVLKQIPAAEHNPKECIKTNACGAGRVTHKRLPDIVRLLGRCDEVTVAAVRQASGRDVLPIPPPTSDDMAEGVSCAPLDAGDYRILIDPIWHPVRRVP